MSYLKRDSKTGTHRAVSPTPKKDISQEPDMIRLKELVAELPPDRQEALNKYLTDQAEAVDRADQDDDPQEFTTLDVPDIATLKQMIQWWRNRERESSTVHEAPIYRPVFIGRRDNKGIRVNRRLINAALNKARLEFPGATSKGALSPTVEFLAWWFLNFDEKYLREVNEDVSTESK